jgi:hypothetical protein
MRGDEGGEHSFIPFGSPLPTLPQANRTQVASELHESHELVARVRRRMKPLMRETLSTETHGGVAEARTEALSGGAWKLGEVRRIGRPLALAVLRGSDQTLS